MDKFADDGRLEAIRRSLEVLSAPALDQVAHLCHISDSGAPAPVDELGLEYDAAYASFVYTNSTISDALASVLRQINEGLDQMSGEENSALWTLESLDKAREWDGVRTLAKHALRLLELPQ